MAVQIAGRKSPNSFLKSFDDIPTDVLKVFFSKNETARNVFPWAKEFEALAFKKDLVLPDGIDAQLKGVISIILDYANIERRKFFEAFHKST